MTDSNPSVLSLTVQEAPNAYPQEVIRGAAVELFSGRTDFDPREFSTVFSNAGIERRTLALKLEQYRSMPGPEERNLCYLEVGGAMLLEAAERALPQDLRDGITHVVTVSTTGIATPSLECDVLQALGLPDSVRRIPVFGLGCAGGVAGLQIARDLAQGSPDVRVLLLVVELTSLTLLGGDASRTNFIACALFGDGAAAAVIGAPAPEHPGLVRLGEGLTHLFPNSKDLMGWQVEEGGWRVLVSPRIPTVVKREIAGLVSKVCRDERPEHWVLHPGGQKILDSYRGALELTDAEMEDSARVLAAHGNMSAVTALFILHRMLSGDARVGSGVATAFGPGFSAEVLGLEFIGATIR